MPNNKSSRERRAENWLNQGRISRPASQAPSARRPFIPLKETFTVARFVTDITGLPSEEDDGVYSRLRFSRITLVSYNQAAKGRRAAYQRGDEDPRNEAWRVATGLPNELPCKLGKATLSGCLEQPDTVKYISFSFDDDSAARITQEAQKLAHAVGAFDIPRLDMTVFGTKSLAEAETMLGQITEQPREIAVNFGKLNFHDVEKRR